MGRPEIPVGETAIDPLTITREDELYGGTLIKNGLAGFNGNKVARKKGRFAGGRDRMILAKMKARMSALWADDITYKDIAHTVNEEFGLDGDNKIGVHGIHYHIKEMLGYWREKSLISIDEKQALVLARYDQLEMLITEAYFESCMGKRTTGYERQIERANSAEKLKNDAALKKRERAKLSKNEKRELLFDNGTAEDTMIMTLERVKNLDRLEEAGAGNPKFLQMLIDINDKRAKLWGLLNRKDSINGDQEMAQMSDEQREERMATILHNAMTRKSQNKGHLAPASPLGGFAEGEKPEEVTEIEKEEIAETDEIDVDEVDDWDL